VERIATEELDRIAVQHALFQSLYREAPEQEEAVERAEEYLKENPAGTADLYGHLACAYAQRYQRERDAGKPATDPELKQLLDAAVKNAEEAVKRDPEWGPILHDLYYAPADAVEDDWAVFRGPENDPDNKVKSFIDKLQSTARA
jgi:lipopolysaccharide biosynthesis regulator YciM